MSQWMMGLQISVVLTDGQPVEKYLRGVTCPATVWVNPAAGDTITVSYSLDNGATYTEIVATTTKWEVRLDSGITHLKFQRTDGAGTTSTCGVC